MIFTDFHFLPVIRLVLESRYFPAATGNALWTENGSGKQSLSVCTPAPLSTPPFTIQWYHKNFNQDAQFTKVGAPGDTLSFNPVKRTHAGKYIARFMHSNQIIDSSQVSSTVHVNRKLT